MNTINPRSLKIIRSLPPKLTANDRVAIDTEWTGMVDGKLHRPTGNFACVTFCADGKTVYVVEDEKDVSKALKNVNAAVWIMHNAKFDMFHLRRLASIPNREKLWDSLLIEKIMWSGYYDAFSLGDLARRYLDIYLEKDTREEFAEHTGPMTQSQIEYAAIDTVATWRVYQEQKKVIEENDLDIWANIDLPALWMVLEMEPLRLDTKAWIALAKKNRADGEKVAAKYTGMNLGSWQQVLKELQRQGIKAKSTNKDDLQHFAVKSEFVRDVLEYRQKMKAAGTYGDNWITDHVEDGDLIYSEFIVNGAGTGRFSSRNPNVENIPIRDTEEFRKCFIPREGYVYVDADWSSQEPRITAYLSGDEQLIDIFKRGKDVYIESAKLMFGWDLDKKDPRRKTRMKPTVLGASYGLTEYGMEKKYQVPKAEGKMYLDTFFDTFHGMREWKETQQAIKTYVTTIYGRKFWLNPYMQGSENNALNSPVQGSAGDAMKLAAIKFMECVHEMGYEKDVHLINLVHDEIVIESTPKRLKWTEKTLRSVMVGVAEDMHKGIPADVEIHTGKNWSEAHG